GYFGPGWPRLGGQGWPAADGASGLIRGGWPRATPGGWRGRGGQSTPVIGESGPPPIRGGFFFGFEAGAKFAQIAQTRDRAAAVPRHHLAIDERDRTLRAEAPPELSNVALAKPIGLRCEQEDIGALPVLLARFGIARRRLLRQRTPAGKAQHVGNVGGSRHGHPRIAPHEIQRTGCLPCLRGFPQRVLALQELAAKRFCRFLARENRAEETKQRDIVVGLQRMRNDDVRHRAAQRSDDFLAILVHVDYEVSRRERRDAVEVDVLGATHFGNPPDFRLRMDTETGAAYDFRAQAEGEEQLGQARDEAHD